MAQGTNQGTGASGSGRVLVVCTEEDFPREERPLCCGASMVKNGTNRYLCRHCGRQPQIVYRPKQIMPGPPCPLCGTQLRSKGMQWLCRVCDRWFKKGKQPP